MDLTHILDPLNKAQRDAVAAPPGHQLVLAGAGSGKTRVLVHRVAWLLATGEAAQWSIYVVTFTNKAAGEMRTRIEHMLGRPTGGMWVGTFHGLANRLLRAHAEEAGLPTGFQILDSEDQLRCIRRVLRDLDLDEKRWAPRRIQGFINARKDEGLRARHVEQRGDRELERLVAIYRAYEEVCRRNGVVDFAELLLRTHELFRDRDDILAHYRRRFTHLLVDEFQDTNAIQYAWLRLLAGSEGLVFAVGDDDQSIYSWRGARAGHLGQFTRDFPDVTVFRLEQNYRSTRTILGAANALIAHNRDRLGKELWTAGDTGEPITLYAAFNEVDEARFVVSRAQHSIEGGMRRSDIAVLYRVSAQSRILEESLLAAGLPYRVYGGLRFYERAEVKDALAYLRLVANRHDDAAFERVVNTPPRGIGSRTVDTLRGAGARSRVLVVGRDPASAGNPRAQLPCGGRARNLCCVHRRPRERGPGPRRRRAGAPRSRAQRAHRALQAGGGGSRADPAENLDELASAAVQFCDSFTGEDEEEARGMTSFLAHAALESGEEQAGDDEDSLHLMTLHAAKGLEFPVVFLTGLEEGLFPHQRSIDEPGRLEEERRLCYVGMTRARQQLVLSYAEIRRLHGSERFSPASRFVREIPAELVEEVRLRARVSRPLYREALVSRAGGASSSGQFRLGQRVNHPKFGEGVVLTLEGDGDHARVQVNFADAGAKWLVLAYAKLHPPERVAHRRRSMRRGPVYPASSPACASMNSMAARSSSSVSAGLPPRGACRPAPGWRWRASHRGPSPHVPSRPRYRRAWARPRARRRGRRGTAPGTRFRPARHPRPPR